MQPALVDPMQRRLASMVKAMVAGRWPANDGSEQIPLGIVNEAPSAARTLTDDARQHAKEPPRAMITESRYI